MSPAWIRKRPVAVSKRNPRGATYQVLYRRGGRGYPIETAGTFRTEREAKLRRDLVGGWLAQTLNPKHELAKLSETPAVTRTYRETAEAYRQSRIDHSAAAVRNVESHLLRLNAIFGDKTPEQITVTDCIEAVAVLAADLKPSSLSRYWTTHKLVLDFAGVSSNPARARLVKLPTIRRQEASPPPSDHVLAILDLVAAKWRLPLVVSEQTAMAGGELEQLAWGDVDVDGSRFRLRRATVKAQIRARARWVQLPEWLMAVIDASCPPDDRTPERRVFDGFNTAGARTAMARACRAARIPVYSPHDLRHRRISLWHGQGVPARELAARAGHSTPSLSLDVYSHLMPLDEVPVELLERLLVMPR